MKKIVAIISIVAAFSAADVFAENGRYYADLSYVLPKAEEAGFSVTMPVVAGRLGMNFTENFAGEIFLGTSAGSDSVTISNTDFKFKFKNMVGMYLKGSLPVAQNLSVFGRVGYLYSKIEASSSVSSNSGSDSGFSYGAGVQFAFTNTVYGTVDYMSFYETDGTTFSGPSFGVGMKF